MKDFEDALLEISWNNLSTEQNRYKDSDTKAVSLVTIAGILATLLIGFGSADGSMAVALFVFSVSFMLLTVVFSVASMLPKHVDALSTRLLINNLEDADTDKKVPGIIATVADAEDSLRKVNNNKAKWILLSAICLAIAVISMLIYSLFLFAIS